MYSKCNSMLKNTLSFKLFNELYEYILELNLIKSAEYKQIPNYYHLNYANIRLKSDLN